MSENLALRLTNVSKSFPGVQALSDVTFDVRAGEVHCLIGENGAGKSTLIKILAGVQRSDGGTIELFGDKVDFSSPIESLNSGIGVVYQELSNFKSLDVAHNIFPNRIHARHGVIDRNQLHAEARKRLDALGLKDVDTQSPMEDISLGQQQMVEIARLVGDNARIMILDEPTSALTEAESEVLFELIEQMKQRGITVIYISHRLDEVLRLSDSITILKDGTHVTTFTNGPEVTKDDLVRGMVGREVVTDYRVLDQILGETALELRNLSSEGAVSDVSFELKRGEVLGIAGLEGSGRTAVLESVFGLREVTSGQILLNSSPVEIKNPIEAKKKGLAYITKDRRNLGLFLGLPVQTNIIAASQEKGVKGGLINKNLVASAAEYYVDAMSIKCSSLDQEVLNLSGGNQQKVLLSMWMNTDPQIIMIDEPTRGIDVSAKAEIHRLLHEFVEEGNSVLLVSSELTELMASCDRILVMHEGKLVGDLPNNEKISEEQIMALASGL